jgi:hypothetical protein
MKNYIKGEKGINRKQIKKSNDQDVNILQKPQKDSIFLKNFAIVCNSLQLYFKSRQQIARWLQMPAVFNQAGG